MNLLDHARPCLRLRDRRATYRGWTLLELLIVISLIAVLVSLFVPACWQFYKYTRHLTGKD